MWSTENWIQDDTKLSGYPAPSGTAYPEAFSLGGFVSLWEKSASGYFIPSEDISPFSIDGFATIWLFNHQFNGYPHPAEFPLEVEWSDPVTDRTSNDIKNAIKNTNKKKTNPAIDFEYTKAYMNYTDLNRIEGNTAYLANKVSSSGSYNLSWSMEDIPLVADRTRILLNMSNVRTAFVTAYPETEVVQMPIKLSSWSDFNQLETLQFQIYSTLLAESE